MKAVLWWALTVVVGGFLFCLAYERAQAVAIWLVKLQCRVLPIRDRVETEAEWVALVSEVEGDAWKVLNAFGLTISVFVSYFETEVPEEETSSDESDLETETLQDPTVDEIDEEELLKALLKELAEKQEK